MKRAARWLLRLSVAAAMGWYLFGIGWGVVDWFDHEGVVCGLAPAHGLDIELSAVTCAATPWRPAVAVTCHNECCHPGLRDYGRAHAHKVLGTPPDAVPHLTFKPDMVPTSANSFSTDTRIGIPEEARATMLHYLARLPVDRSKASTGAVWDGQLRWAEFGERYVAVERSGWVVGFDREKGVVFRYTAY